MKLSDKKTSEIPPESGAKIISLNKKNPREIHKHKNFLST